jgi:CS domain
VWCKIKIVWKAESLPRNDFYQTPTSVIASIYLKNIDKAKAKVDFSSPTTLDLDLPTSDSKRYVQTVPLFAPIDPKASQFKIMGMKLELTLVKADGSSWPVLRSDEARTGEIIQVGRPGRA